MEADSDFDPQMVDRYRLGGNIVRSPVCFSDDEKTFFCCAGSVVKTFNVATGALLGVLEGHTARITSVMINPNNALQVFTTSHDGTVRKWDYIESTCLQVYTVNNPILRAVIGKNHMYVYVDPHHYSRILDKVKDGSINVKGKDVFMNLGAKTGRVYSLNITAKTTQIHLLYKNLNARALAISANHQYLATTSDNVLSVYHIPTNQKVEFEHKCNLTTLAFHPSEPMIATGDAKGRVVLWVNYLPSFAALTANNQAAEAGNKTVGAIPTPATTIFHWHAHAVSALAFSEDGSYILSGGEEAVLVFWQIETGHKQFLPRLGEALLHITTSPQGALYAVACADNAIRMVNALNNKIMHTIQGLQHATSHLQSSASLNVIEGDAEINARLAEQLQKSVGNSRIKEKGLKITASNLKLDVASGTNEDLEAQLEDNTLSKVMVKSLSHAHTGLVTHPQTGHIVVPGKVGHLQLYDAVADQHVGSIAVVDRNYISRSDVSEVPPQVSVEHVAFSPNGTWMATVDRFNDKQTTERISLKLWMRNGALDTTPALNTTSGNIFGSSKASVASMDAQNMALARASVAGMNAGYTLNTRAENVHMGRITSIAFHPTQNLLVTTSTDHTFKLWALNSKTAPAARTNVAKGQHQSLPEQDLVVTYMWACVGTGDYRGTPVTSCAFSSDGSVLAVAFGQVITLWAASANELTLKTTLVHPPPFSPLRWLRFVANSSHLVAVTHTSLYVWNVLTCTVSWSYHMQTAAITTHPTLPYLAALVVLPHVPATTGANTRKRARGDAQQAEEATPVASDAEPLKKKPAKRCAILIFHVDDATPLRVLDASDARFEKSKTTSKRKEADPHYNLFTSTSIYTSCLAFMPRLGVDGSNLPTSTRTGLPLDGASLIYLNRSRELIRVPNALHSSEGDHSAASALLALAHRSERRAAMQASMMAVPSVFSLIYNNQVTNNAVTAANASVVPLSAEEVKHTSNRHGLHAALQAFLNTPAHVLGSLSMAYNAYMEAFLRKKQRTEE